MRTFVHSGLEAEVRHEASHPPREGHFHLALRDRTLTCRSALCG
jgi:hypothetical protein